MGDPIRLLNQGSLVGRTFDEIDEAVQKNSKAGSGALGKFRIGEIMLRACGFASGGQTPNRLVGDRNLEGIVVDARPANRYL